MMNDLTERMLLIASAHDKLRDIEKITGPLSEMCQEAILTAFTAGATFGVGRAKIVWNMIEKKI